MTPTNDENATDESSNATDDDHERATAHPDVEIGAVYLVAHPPDHRDHEGQFIALDAYDDDEEVFEGVTEAGEVITIPPKILEAWLSDNLFLPVENPDELADMIHEVRP